MIGIRKAFFDDEDYSFLKGVFEKYSIETFDQLKTLIYDIDNHCDDDIILAYLIFNEQISDSELNSFIVNELDFTIEERIVETLRWTYLVETIVKIENRYFSILWERAATEYQDNNWFDTQFTEVVPVEKTIIVYEEKTNEKN